MPVASSPSPHHFKHSSCTTSFSIWEGKLFLPIPFCKLLSYSTYLLIFSSFLFWNIHKLTEKLQVQFQWVFFPNHLRPQSPVTCKRVYVYSLQPGHRNWKLALICHSHQTSDPKFYHFSQRMSFTGKGPSSESHIKFSLLQVVFHLCQTEKLLGLLLIFVNFT